MRMLRWALLVTLVASTAHLATASKHHHVSDSAKVVPSTSGDAYVFSYFKGNGADGLHLAYSEDGLDWHELNGGKSLLQPVVGRSKLMRDPEIITGPDG